MSGIFSEWRWDWDSLCGPEGLKIWSKQTNDLGLCFQQLFLQIPALSLLGTLSAYYFGRNGRRVVRGSVQMISINCRCLMIFFMSVLPVLQIYVDLYKSELKILKISYFHCVVQVLTWLTHLCFCLSLRNYLGLSSRGPLKITATWLTVSVLTIVSLRSNYLRYKHDAKSDFSVHLSFAFSLCYFLLQLVYAISLIPGKGDTVYAGTLRNLNQPDENTPLLIQNTYVRLSSEELDPSYLGVAMENHNIISRLLFSWVSGLMEKGEMKKLKDSEDLFDLPDALHCSAIGSKMAQNLDQLNIVPSSRTDGFYSATKYKFSLLSALHRCFWKEFFGVGLLKFVSDCSGFAGPLLLNQLVGFIENGEKSFSWGYLYVIGLATTTLAGALCDTHFQFRMAVVGFKMRAALITSIYRKIIHVKTSSLNSSFSVGEIVNFMSTDTDRIVNSCPSFHAVWSIPFQLSVVLYLLYTQVGIAFLPGLVFSLVLIPINKVIADKIGQYSTKLMAEKDSRVRLITEVIRGIKPIKLYVWEQFFIKAVTKLRERELKFLKRRKYLDALCVYFWATTPVSISILTFTTYALMGNKLTAATVFTGIALLNMLISPLNAFPWVLNGITEAWVSLKRIQKLMDLYEKKLINYNNEELLDDNENYDIIIENGTFDWGKEMTEEERKQLHDQVQEKSLKGKGKIENVTFEARQKFQLNNLNVGIKRGDFVGVIGTVGSGKSSLLSCILGELNMTQGSIGIRQECEGFGLVTQRPWLQRGTIRDNILFGKTFDEQKYKTVLFSCGLTEDLATLPSGDSTGVSDGGTTLSGGQKARIALARAVYEDKNVYLFDDILSAVDVKVARHIFQHCILNLLKQKTRILCTHLVEYLAHADKIISMKNGTLCISQGTAMEFLRDIDRNLTVDLELGGEEMTPTRSSSSVENSLTHAQKNAKKNQDTVLGDEQSERGTVEWSVIKFYLRSASWPLVFLILASVTIMQTSRNFTDFWLSLWVTSDEGNETNGTEFFLPEVYEFEPTDYYLKIYIELAIFNSFFTLMRAFLFAYGGIKAATKIHRMMLKTVVKGKSTFFDVSPVGRILNRFSSDTYTVDDTLPFITNILLAQIFGLLGTLVITIYGLPWICLIMVPLIPVYNWLQQTYRKTSRELKRISSTTLSPVYSHFNETLQGAVTIRAFRANKRFRKENEHKIEENIKAQFSSQAAARWLGLRLQCIGVAMVTGVSLIAVIQHQNNVADPGLIGLAVSYALSVTGSLGGVINAFTETEREMIAVERVNQYVTQIPSETIRYTCEPPFGWPSQGVIIFSNVVLKYREHLPPSLNDVTFETRPFERIGIVGRTGAGKSSLISALFRLVELNSGSIFIDMVDISEISLAALRSRMFCIPQEPFLFTGTLRSNLDPLGEFRDGDIWSALDKVNLTSTIKTLGGLDGFIESGGVNFSVGQQQLICLARAVLHNAKVICIDEATANVDQETDRLIQSTISSAFRQSTILTIAHRIDTILNSDRVLVMSDGQIVEFDTPDNLLNDPTSYFYQIVNCYE